MRRTEQEFKAEILRREKDYRMRQKRLRKQLLGTAVCLLLIMGGLSFLWMPAGKGANEMILAPQSPEMVMDAEMPAMEAPAADAVQENSSISGSSGLVTAEPSLEDAAVIQEYLDADWIESLSDCSCDYLVVIGARELRYHSDCGTFQDYRGGYSLTVSEEARCRINAILAKY